MASIIVTKGKSRGNYLPLRAGTLTLGRDVRVECGCSSCTFYGPAPVRRLLFLESTCP